MSLNGSGNALFIPEIRLEPSNAVNAMYAIAQHNAIGFSPFSIESAEDTNAELLTGGYDLLTQLAPLISAHQGKGTMLGLAADSPETQRVPQQFKLNGYTLGVTYERPNANSVSGGLVIAVGPDDFIFAGTSVVVTFTPDSPGDPIAGLLSVQEGKYVNGQWVPGRWLNGDQTHQGRHIRLEGGKFTIQRVKLYRYKSVTQSVSRCLGIASGSTRLCTKANIPLTAVSGSFRSFLRLRSNGHHESHQPQLVDGSDPFF